MFQEHRRRGQGGSWMTAMAALLMIAVAVSGCLTTEEAAAAASSEPAAPQAILTGAVPEVKGPKRIVAIGGFDTIGAFTAKYGHWDIATGCAEIQWFPYHPRNVCLLPKSGRFEPHR